ncbi:MAG: hypothetical protein HONBIEJF_01820 [Fimbriimonadaceae bacterium]|nr:hypothetical protein [Fimbriimonadaceae bacterium]
MRQGAATSIWAIVAAPLILLILGAVAALVASSSPDEIARQLGEPAVHDALLISLKTTLISLVIVLVMGTGLALLIAQTRGMLAGGLELVATLPAILPPSVVGIALLLAFGRQGLFGRYLEDWGIAVAFSPIAVVMAQTFVATPFYVREAAIAFQSVDPAITDAARIDGVTPAQLFAKITMPMAAPFLVTGAILAWTRALSEFGATILFAGSMQGITQTLPVAIYFGFESSLEQAKAIAMILLAAACVALLAVRFLLARRFASAH